MHSPEQWAAHLFSEWGADAILFVGGRVFDCKHSEDGQGQIFWRAVLDALCTIIDTLCAGAHDMDEPQLSRAVH
jgi:coenzyme F420-reducing hydrogenase delta subunit